MIVERCFLCRAPVTSHRCGFCGVTCVCAHLQIRAPQLQLFLLCGGGDTSPKRMAVTAPTSQGDSEGQAAAVHPPVSPDTAKLCLM